MEARARQRERQQSMADSGVKVKTGHPQYKIAKMNIFYTPTGSTIDKLTVR